MEDPSTKQQKMIKFIKDNFRQKRCAKFVPREKKPDICTCNLRKDDHNLSTRNSIAPSNNFEEANYKQVNEQVKPIWKAVETKPTCFGEIQFRGFSLESTNPAPYIRVSEKTKVEKLWTLVHDYWDLKTPDLIISITGGAKSFSMNKRLKDSFTRGLVTAATSIGAWIVTGGMNAGVMKLVGEAVREHNVLSHYTENNIVALGIATWGIVDGNENLNSLHGSGCFPAEYELENVEDIDRLSPVDHNHTHFIFVDNGTVKDFGIEIELRVELESFISSNGRKRKHKDSGEKIPIVLLVLEGGVNTLKNAASAIKQGTPLVVIQDSGRAADLISKAYHATRSDKDTKKSKFPDNFDELFKKEIEKSFFSKDEKKNNETEIVQSLMDLKELLKKRNYLTVFQLDEDKSTNEIDHAILNALLKINTKPESQLALALAWNRCDLAKSEIFSTKDSKKKKQNLKLKRAIMEALISDKPDFVQLFLENGIDIKTFLTVQRLKQLYWGTLNRNKTDAIVELVKSLYEKSKKSFFTNCYFQQKPYEEKKFMYYMGKGFSELIGLTKNFYSSEKYVVDDNSNKQTSNKQNLDKQDSDTNVSDNNYLENSERDLFLWAVVFNRRRLAYLFWKLGKDHIGAALAAMSILKALSDKARKDQELDISVDLVNHSIEWEERAIGTLNECYLRNKEFSHCLLVRNLSTWGGSTVMSLADSSQSMLLMGHSCCQTKLNRIWKGEISQATSRWKIFITAFFPILIYIPHVIEFRNSDITLAKDEVKQIEKKHSSGPKSSVKTLDPNTSMRGKNFHNEICPNPVEDSIPSQNLLSQSSKNSINNDRVNISPLEKWLYFFSTPIVKFMYHTLNYVVFLIIFSFFILTNLKPYTSMKNISILEYIIWGWLLMFAVEEIRKMLSREKSSVLFRVRNFKRDFWLFFDIAVSVFIAISISLRFTLSAQDFIWARSLYCLTLATFYLRFMPVFYAYENVGPKVIMIQKMLTDLLFFFAIFIIFLLSYGIASHALRFPNSKIEWSLLKNIVYLPYWQMYGELFLDDVSGDDCKNSTNSGETCPEKTGLAVILFAIYMILTNILLINLLIAMFSNTFEKVQGNSENFWRYYRYSLIRDYLDRPSFAPPLNMISYIWIGLRYCLGCNNINQSTVYEFNQKIPDDLNKRMSLFEKACMKNYLIKSKKSNKEKIEEKVSSISEKIENFMEEIEKIKISIQ